MLILSVCQPWAALLVCGVKLWETRSFAPRDQIYSQPLAIHALPCPYRQLPPQLLRAIDYAAMQLPADAPDWPGILADLPSGSILGHVQPTYAISTGSAMAAEVGELQRQLGDWRLDRWAWHCDRPHICRTRIPHPGSRYPAPLAPDYALRVTTAAAAAQPIKDLIQS